MPTPTAGTVQQYLSPAVIPPPTFRQFVQRRLRGWVLYCGYVWSILLPYNVLSCFLGRYILDHEQLWKRKLPPGTDRSRGKDGELIAATIAAVLSSPLSLCAGLLAGIVSDKLLIDPATAKHSERVASFAILYVPGTVLAVVASVAISAEIMHVWFKYVDPVSLIGVYCFGSVIMVPTSLLLGVIGLRLHSMWKGRQR